MAEKKRQHLIPKCYLKAWCDPRTPPGQHPYIWRISRDGTEKKNKSPEKSFTATDRYTIKMPGGGRNLIIENTLSGVENDFVSVLSRIRRQERLNLQDRVRLCLFVAAMQARTMAMGEHWRTQTQKLHDMVSTLEQTHGAPRSTSLQTEKMVEHAHQQIIATSLATAAPILSQMHMAVFVANDEMGFITSDNPCVWFNPKLHKFPPLYRSPGLAQRDIEVTLPLTPHHLLFISHRPSSRFYVDVSQTEVDEANRLTRFHCAEEFVSWKGETRSYWFERGHEPEDTWEKSQERQQMIEKRDRILRELATGNSTEGQADLTAETPATEDPNQNEK